MKSTIQLILIAALSALAACCGSEKKLVEQSADKYLNAMANYNFTEAGKYATPQTQEVTLNYIEKNIMPYLDSSFMEKNTPAKIRIRKITMTSDSTATVFYHKTTPINRANDSLHLVKIDNVWQASQIIVRPGDNGSNKTVKRKTNPFKAAKQKEESADAE